MPELVMPDVGESVTEGTVTRWLKQPGDTVVRDEIVVEIETEKVEVEVPSPFEGVLAEILVQEGEVAPVGAPLARFEASGREAAASAPSPQPAAKPAEAAARAAVDVSARSNGAARRTRRYSPVVMKLAAEHDIDLSLVQGTGIEGRVTRQDVLRYMKDPVTHTVPPPDGAGVVGVAGREEERPAAAQGSTPEAGDADVTPLSPMRRTIARNMLESHRTVPVAWMALEVDVTELVALRERLKHDFERSERARLTYMPFFVQAVVAALKRNPALNATLEGEAVRRHRRYDIGIAVATDAGLVVPVLREADGKSIAGIARDLDRLGDLARARKLALDDVRGATFTLDNTGAFGSLISQPIVPPGQVAIITTEAIRRELRPRDDGSIAARLVMNICISFDHRALDGAEAGAFMRDVKAHLESIRADQAVY